MMRLALTLIPLDVLFFRDGRPFDAESRAESGLPTPQVVAGALRTALLEAHGARFNERQRSLTFGDFVAAVCKQAPWIAKVRFRGPWLVRMHKEEPAAVDTVLVPAPAILHRAKKPGGGDVVRLKPLAPGKSLPGWKGTGRPLWAAAEAATEPVGGFLTLDGLKKFLADKDVAAADIVRPDELYTFDNRTGLEINAQRLAAEEGRLFGVRFLVLKEHLRFLVEVDLPDEAPADAFAGVSFVSLGGEGRRARIERAEPVIWPETTTGPNRLLLMATPGLFGGAIPKALDGRLTAAAVPAPVAVSGWDLARQGPKPTRFAAPAGSVYFLNDNDDVSLNSADPELGFGVTLTGGWTDA